MRRSCYCCKYSISTLYSVYPLFAQHFISCVAKFEEDFAKYEINNFAKFRKRKFSQPPYADPARLQFWIGGHISPVKGWVLFTCVPHKSYGKYWYFREVTCAYILKYTRIYIITVIWAYINILKWIYGLGYSIWSRCEVERVVISPSWNFKPTIWIIINLS